MSTADVMASAVVARDAAARKKSAIALLEMLHDAHRQCAELSYNLGRLERTHTHFRACREIVLAIAKIEDPRGIQ